MSKVDFRRIKERPQKDIDCKALRVLVMGEGQGGKSSLCGSMGVKTLYLYFKGETHGPKNAMAHNKTTEIDAYRIDVDFESGEKLGAEATIAQLMDFLDPEGLSDAGYEAVVVDSMYELDQVIRQTLKFKRDCESNNGKHNVWEEPKAILAQLRPILFALDTLTVEHNIHHAITCPLDVKSKGEFGEITEATPKITGGDVAQALARIYHDVIAVGPMVRNGKTVQALQFGASIQKNSKDANGDTKKYLNFRPRLSGVTDLPEYAPANLARIIEAKEKGAFDVKAKT